MAISTHVLDAVRGRAAAGLAVHLEQRTDDGWVLLTSTVTNADGRVPVLHEHPSPGVYRLTFDTEDYLDVETFYPQVVVTVRITDPAQSYHVPLLLSPFAYSTYRGS
jgi:5-hydroxyisourate hydrolase